MAVIYPALGEEKAVAQQLLNMAMSAKDVKVITDTAPGTGYIAFEVPDELCDRYAEAQLLREEIETRLVEAADKEEAPAPKRRGRPRKVQKVEEPFPDNSTDEEDLDPEE